MVRMPEKKPEEKHKILGGGYNEKNIIENRNYTVADGGYNPNKIIIDRTDGKGEVTRATYYPHNDSIVIDKRETKKKDQ